MLSAPKLLPFQFLALARNINVAIFIAIAQLGPHFGSSETPGDNGSVPSNALSHLEYVARAAQTEASRLLDLCMAPVAANPAAIQSLKGRLVREWLVQNTIRADPVVREAVDSAMERRRQREAS